MTQQIRDDQLQPYYESFDNRHDQLRGKLFDLLSDTRVVEPDRSNGWRSSRTMYQRLTLAALLLIAVGLSTFYNWSPTQPAFGIENLAERLLTIRSIHLQGWIYQVITTEEGVEKAERFPTEMYARRPNCIGYRSYGFSLPGNGKPSTVTSGSTASDGQRSITISHDTKTALTSETPGDAFYTELMVESQIQASLASRFLQGPLEQYRKVRSEEVEDVLCDLYEYKARQSHFGGKHRVWINPLTGLPVKSETYVIVGDGNEELMMSETIAVNVEPPSSLFSFLVPDGYLETKLDNKKSAELTAAGVKLFPIGSGGSDTTWLATWHGLNIDNRAVLVCWSQYDTVEEQKKWFAREPEFELSLGNQMRPCRVETLTNNSVDETQWRWSLIFPEDGKPLGNDLLQFRVSDKRTQAEQELKPLRFPRKRLREIILEAQRRTLPDDSEQELFTLKQIESK